jgi:hypothetical protein
MPSALGLNLSSLSKVLGQRGLEYVFNLKRFQLYLLLVINKL